MATGGVAVYGSEYFQYSVRHDMSRNEEVIFESMFIEIKTQTIPLIVGNICSIPSFLQIPIEVLEAIRERSYELVIMDNFNINLRDLRSLSSLDFLSVILACDTLPSAYIPTCITDPTASLLDNIFLSLSWCKILYRLVTFQTIYLLFPV